MNTLDEYKKINKIERIAKKGTIYIVYTKNNDTIEFDENNPVNMPKIQEYINLGGIITDETNLLNPFEQEVENFLNKKAVALGYNSIDELFNKV